MGMRVTRAEPALVELSLTVGERHLQPFGLVHGGVISGAVETVCSIGGSLNAGPDHTIVGMENQTSFLRPVREGTLRAIATPLHLGRTSQLWEARVLDERDRLVASGRLRMACLPKLRTKPAEQQGEL